MKQIIGVVCFVITIVAIGANAILMLISPRTWFRLPSWIRLSGSLVEEKFGRGWGGIQVRALGGLFLAVISWFLFEALFSRR